MFDVILSTHQLSLKYFEQLDREIPDEHYHTRPHGVGNSPLWIAGHLAVCVEFGEMLLGESPRHPDWLAAFGPGSAPDVADPETYDRRELHQLIVEGYPRLLEKIRVADPAVLSEPHGVELLEETPLATKQDLLVHLVTTHITFHLAQLSACRRALGQQPLF